VVDGVPHHCGEPASRSVTGTGAFFVRTGSAPDADGCGVWGAARLFRSLLACLVAPVCCRHTVTGMRPCRRRRAMTLTELTLTVVLLSILVLLAFFTGGLLIRNQGDIEVRNMLIQVVAAQHVRHDTLGSFAIAESDLADLSDDVSFVDSATAPTQDRQFSISVQTVDGEQRVVVAGVGLSGRCYAIESFEPNSRTDDVRVVFDADRANCTAAAALASQDGESW
jgi:type II secretory pathway pseudopilin PulG